MPEGPEIRRAAQYPLNTALWKLAYMPGFLMSSKFVNCALAEYCVQQL